MSAEQGPTRDLEVVPRDGSAALRKSFISRVVRALRVRLKTGEGRRPRYEQREYFNSDRTKKFAICVDEGNTPGWQFREVGLYARGFDPRSWNAMMSLRRTGTGDQTKFTIEIYAIADGELLCSTKLFAYDSEGNLRDLNTFSRPPRDEHGQRQEEKERQHMHNLGCYHAGELPLRINFNKTAEQFLHQAANRDFQMPQLFPYEEPPILER